MEKGCWYFERHSTRNEPKVSWGKIYVFEIKVNIKNTQHRQYQNDFKLRTYVKIAELYLEEADSAQAEVNLSRAASLEKDTKDPALQIKYKSVQARVWDFKRKFVEAAAKYYELSLNSVSISEADRTRALNQVFLLNFIEIVQ